MINPRAETFSPKPAYRNTFKHRRCLISAEGFYECQAGQGGNTPFLTRCKDNDPFAISGLQERWPDADGAALQSCSVSVTEANPLVRWVHNRMPVILAREDDANWLDPDNRDTDGLLAVLRSTDPQSRTLHPMSRQVSNASNDAPELPEAVAALPADAPGIEW